jgi:hypothetical protein
VPHLQREGASLCSKSSMLWGRRSFTGMSMAWQKSTATISCWKKDLQAVPISQALQSMSSVQGAQQSSWE